MPGKWGSARPAYIKDKYEMIKQPIFCKVIKHRLSQISEAINSFPRTASSGAVIRNPTHDYTHSHTQTQCRLLTHSLSLSVKAMVALRLWSSSQVRPFTFSSWCILWELSEMVKTNYEFCAHFLLSLEDEGWKWISTMSTQTHRRLTVSHNTAQHMISLIPATQKWFQQYTRAQHSMLSRTIY